MVENWWKLHLLWRVLGCLLSHLLCWGFSGAACGQAQWQWEFNLYAFKGFWEVAAGVSCPGFGVWLRGGAVGCPGCRAHLPVARTDGASEFCGLVYWEVPLVFFYFGGQCQFGCSLQSMFFWVWCFSACVRNIYLCISLIVCGGDLWAGLV